MRVLPCRKRAGAARVARRWVLPRSARVLPGLPQALHLLQSRRQRRRRRPRRLSGTRRVRCGHCGGSRGVKRRLGSSGRRRSIWTCKKWASARRLGPSEAVCYTFARKHHRSCARLLGSLAPVRADQSTLTNDCSCVSGSPFPARGYSFLAMPITPVPKDTASAALLADALLWQNLGRLLNRS